MLESRNSPGAGAQSATAANKSYRCYFTDLNDRIQSFEQIECETDAAAVLKAQALLVASQFTTAELWQGKRLVSKWGNTGEAEPRPETNTSSPAAT